MAALRSAESCNPVLRAQSRATLKYYNKYVLIAYVIEFAFKIFLSANDVISLQHGP